MAGDLLTLMMTSSRTGRGIQLHVRVGCSGVWIWYIVLEHWSFSITTSCLPGKLYSQPPNRYDEITGSCCVARPDRQPNSPGKRQNGCRPHSSTTVLCSAWWEKQSYGMRAKAPLGAIKYSSAIRHRALGSILTALCNKPPRKRLLKTTTTN